MQPIARSRRRKRSRPYGKEESRPEKHLSNGILQRFDDSTETFLDERNGDFLADRRAVLLPLPILMEQRRGGLWSRRRKAWQKRTLQGCTKKRSSTRPTEPMAVGTRRRWRNYASRSIPFTRLGTPISDAVLSLDREGSYMLSLGSKDRSNVPLTLSLRFYAVPSPSAIEKGLCITGPPSTRMSTPLMQTVPLLYDLPEESLEETIFNFRRGISPASTPVKILMSSDWKLGIALFQPSNVWKEENPIGTMVLFSFLPTCQTQRRSTIWRCTNVRMGANSSFAHRNALWRVHRLPSTTERSPMTPSKPGLFECLQNIPGYLFLHDEVDGFRLTWMCDRWSDQDSDPDYHDVDDSPKLQNWIPAPFNMISRERTWERLDADLFDGEVITSPPEAVAGLLLKCEAFFNVEILLNDISSRRKGMAGDHPDFCYNLVSVQGSGRFVELLLTFRRLLKRGSLGVFVQVDLFSGRYRELDWVKNIGAQNAGTLQDWCNNLALNRRMKEVKAGPYSVRSSSTIDWSKLCRETPPDLDQADDSEPIIWKTYVESGEEIAKRKPPKFVSLSTLFPDCDLITNKAITDCIPVSSIRCKDSPLQLIYG